LKKLYSSGDEFASADSIARSTWGFFAEFHDSLFDITERALRPLYRIETNQGIVRVLFDMPFVAKKEDLTLLATEDTISVEANMEKSVSILVGGSYQRNVEFDKYRIKLRLSEKVDPSKAKAKFEKGILAVEFPVKKTSHSIRIT